MFWLWGAPSRIIKCEIPVAEDQTQRAPGLRPRNTPRGRPASVEYVEEDLAQSRDEPPPEEYPPRKTGLRGIPVVEELVQSRNRPPPEEYPPRKVGVRGIPLAEGLLQQLKRHQRVCEAAGKSSKEYLKNPQHRYLLALGSPVAHYQVWNTRNRPPPEEYPPRKTGVRGIPAEEDLAQCRNRPPPGEYPPRKVGVRGMSVVADLAQCRNRPPPEEYPLRKIGVRGIPFMEDLLQ